MSTLHFNESLLIQYAANCESQHSFKFKMACWLHEKGALKSFIVRRFLGINLENLAKRVANYVLFWKEKEFETDYNQLLSAWAIKENDKIKINITQQLVPTEVTIPIAKQAGQVFFNKQEEGSIPIKQEDIEEIEIHPVKKNPRKSALRELEETKHLISPLFVEQLEEEIKTLSEETLAKCYTLQFQDQSFPIHYPLWRYFTHHFPFFSSQCSFNENNQSSNPQGNQIIICKEVKLEDFVNFLHDLKQNDEEVKSPENIYLFLYLANYFQCSKLETKYRNWLNNYLKDQNTASLINIIKQDFPPHVVSILIKVVSIKLDRVKEIPHEFKPLIDVCVEKQLLIKNLAFSSGLLIGENLAYLQQFPLTQLEFEGTQIDLRALKHIPSLTNLKLMKMTIDEEDAFHLRDATQLKSLVLSHLMIGNASSSEKLDFLNQLTFLKKLDSSSKITEMTTRELALLENLTSLKTINKNPSSSTKFAFLSQLTSLENLDIRFTAITDKELPFLTNLTSLKTLNLSHTKITGKGLDSFVNLTASQTVIYTEITED